MRSLSLVMSECSLSGHGQGHMSNFYIVDLENFATASRQYTGDIHNSTVVGLFMTPIRQWRRLGWVHMFITHRPTLTLQLHNFHLFRICRTSSFCTAAWQLVRFQLTRRIARSLGDSWATCEKTNKSPYLRNRLTDFDEILQGDANGQPTGDRPLKFWNF